MDERLSTCNEAGRDVKLPTVAKELGLLRAALRYAHKHKQFKGDLAHILPDEISGTYVPRDRALSRTEYKKLFAKMSAKRRDYLTAWCLSGTRESELYSIRPEDVDLKGRRLHVRGTKTDGSDRFVEIQQDLLGVLRARMKVTNPGASLFPLWLNVRRDLAAACERAGIDSVRATTSDAPSRPGWRRRACRSL